MIFIFKFITIGIITDHDQYGFVYEIEEYFSAIPAFYFWAKLDLNFKKYMIIHRNKN